MMHDKKTIPVQCVLHPVSSYLFLSFSSLGAATSGTQEKRLPLLPSGPDGVHIHLLRRAVPRLQKDNMAERVGESTTDRTSICFQRLLVTVSLSTTLLFCNCLKASTNFILAYTSVDIYAHVSEPFFH
jgi:hypothetical protein